MLADSDESVESDEEFYFVDDNKNQSPDKKKLSKTAPRRLKAVMKGPEQVSLNSANSVTELSSNPEEFGIAKPDEFAKMMATFDGFNQDSSQENKEKDRQSVRSYRNKLFLATREKGEKNSDTAEIPILGGNGTSGKHAEHTSEVKSDVPSESEKHTGESKDDSMGSMSTSDSCANGSSGLLSEINQQLRSAENTENDEHKIYVNISVATSNEWANNNDVLKKSIKDEDEQILDEDILEEEKRGLTNASQGPNDTSQIENQSIPTQTELQPSSLNETENAKAPSGAHQQPNSDKERNSNQDSQNSSSLSKSLERSQETYITVLPGTLEKPDGNDSKSSDEVTMVDELENHIDSQFNKAGKTRKGKCLSYLVVSGGEGQVDLRLKVKSKQNLKKDAQSMFLIWRVNSKI